MDIDAINKIREKNGLEPLKEDALMRVRMSNYADERFVRTRPEDFKTRDDDGNPIIEGYFAVFNSKYELWEGATETIAPTAFDNSIPTFCWSCGQLPALCRG